MDELLPQEGEAAMSKRPEQCKVPDNVWFETSHMAQRNVARKFDETGERWFVWRCHDHFHVKPKKDRRS